MAEALKELWSIRFTEGEGLNLVGAIDCAGNPFLAFRNKEDARDSAEHHQKNYFSGVEPVQLFPGHAKLLAACKAAADLMLRCDAEIRPNSLPEATDAEWDAVAAQINAAIAEAEPPSVGQVNSGPTSCSEDSTCTEDSAA